MLSILRNNNLISIFLVPLLGLLLWWPSFQHPPIVPVKHTMPLYELLWNFLGNSMNTKIAFAFCLVLFEAFYINLVIDKNNLLPRKSFLPACVFVLLVSSFKDSQQLNPILCALLFVLFSFSKIAKTYRQDSASSQVFDASILISIATLFFFPVIIIYPMIWVALIVIRPFVWREWAISIIGFLTPYLFVLMSYYWNNKVNFFVYDKLIFPANFNINELLMNEIYFKITFTAFILFALWGIAKSISKVPVNTIFARNMAVIFVWVLLLSIATFFLSPQASIIYLLCTFIPLTFYFSSIFIDIKRKWLGEVLFSILILLAISNIYLS